MAQWCVLAARVGAAEPASTRASPSSWCPWTAGHTVRPIRSMLGPHHLNEFFFDGCGSNPTRCWAASARAGRSSGGLSPTRRVGIARYARCDRLLSQWAPPAGGLEACRTAAGQWARALVQCGCPAARLPGRGRTGGGQPRRRHRQRRPPGVAQCDQQVAEMLFQAVVTAAWRPAPTPPWAEPSRTTGATPRPPPWPRGPSRSSA